MGFVDFEVIQRIEVLNEVCAGVIADFDRELEKRNIDITDKTNPVVVLYWQLVILKNSILSKNSMEELQDVRSQLIFIDQYVKKLGR